MLREQTVAQVGVRELSHRTSSVIREVEAGRRIVVTRHGDPQAVVLSVRDAIELLIEPRLDELANSARREHDAGRSFRPWPEAGPVRIAVAAQAEETFGRLPPLDRGGLRRVLGRGEADSQRLLWLPTGRWLVAFSYTEEGEALMHAFIETRPLERELIGEEIWRARLRRDIDRLVHARTPWHRGGG